jgi:ABC-type glycerol-3-phosphate transport system substrate-binding protein
MKSSFQTILIIVFAAAFVGAVAIFSGIFSSGTKSTSTAPSGRVIVWGILPRAEMQAYVDNVINAESLGYTVTYIEHRPEQFVQDFIVSLADNTPPDVLLFSSELYSQLRPKLYVTPYQAYAERTYRDTNIDGAQIFLTKDGVVALPLLVDPLVVYYNKDILAASNFAVPPITWGTLSQTVSAFTKRNAQNNITQSTVALGTEANIDYMRDIVSALFLQTGNSIVSYDSETNRYVATLGDAPNATASADSPVVQGLNFYTSFSNPTSQNYSWNRSLPSSRDMFLAGKLAFYIGRSSDLFGIQAQNPNLNFDVAPLFQPDNAVRPVTFGSFIAAGVVKNSKNFPAAYAAAGLISAKDGVDALSKALTLPPVRRDLLLIAQPNPYISVLFRSALSAFAWPDPNPSNTEQLFRAMITNVTSGRTDPQSAIYETSRDLQSSIR